ncbi:GAF and ANTAR domain-containing protein [Nakamurella endophytica]|uniref:Transcriptional regulator n=1 Tax=Nakamurella endophytica TaxID=1748367 RepID=A0A917WC85_9ACTN|nr:GAF and ANTAR domain-containing protein [Nakamurella endophytica]GGL89197.1 transcriptional regulator [Nakamurella endophytica]
MTEQRATDPIDPTGALGEVAQTVTAGRDMAEILDDVVQMARRRIAGADDASITLIRKGTAATAAATGPLAVDLDELQYEEGYGPCLDSGRTDEILHIEDAGTETRWPRYLERGRASGLGSSVSFPLPVENHLVGAINVYSRTPRAFEADSITLGAALSVHLTSALSAAESADEYRRTAENLRLALRSRAVIEQAKGIIMVQQKCSADTAFGMLRQLSQDTNVRLSELAVQLVASASNHPVEPSEES